MPRCTMGPLAVSLAKLPLGCPWLPLAWCTRHLQDPVPLLQAILVLTFSQKIALYDVMMVSCLFCGRISTYRNNAFIYIGATVSNNYNQHGSFILWRQRIASYLIPAKLKLL